MMTTRHYTTTMLSTNNCSVANEIWYAIAKDTNLAAPLCPEACRNLKNPPTVGAIPCKQIHFAIFNIFLSLN